MKRILAVILALIILCPVCFSESAATDAYDLIEMSFTQDEIIKLLGEGEPAGEYVLFSESVLCAFYESGRLQAKCRVFDKITDAAVLCELPLEKLPSLKQGMPIDEFVDLIGTDGAEIMRINLSDEENAGMRRVIAWQNADGASIQALFEMDDGEWILFALAESGKQTEE